MSALPPTAPIAAQTAVLVHKLAGVEAWLDAVVHDARAEVAALERAVGQDVRLLRRFDGDVRRLLALVGSVETVRHDLARRVTAARVRPEALVGAADQIRDAVATRAHLRALHDRVLHEVEAMLHRPIGAQRHATCTLPDA